jgi:small ligand-binding sensory domain FIST
MSLHPVASLATGEVLGSLLESVGYGPSVVILFVSSKHRESFREIANATNSVLAPRCLLGAITNDVLAGSYETNGESAIVGWAASVGNVRAFGSPRDGFPAGSTSSAVVLATAPEDASLLIDRRHPESGLLIGGVPAASGRFGPQLFLDGVVVDSGFVGVTFEQCDLEPVVSSGAEAIGEPFTVTKSERTVVYDLAFRSALDRLNDVLGELPEDQRLRARQGVHLAIASGNTPRTAAIVREVLGADRANGALSVDAMIEIGDTAQFQIRDQLSALSEIHDQLQHAAASRIDGTLLFASRHRGRTLFGDNENDASTVSGITNAPVAGMFCSHEIGPSGTLGTKPYVHKRYAVAALFRAHN